MLQPAFLQGEAVMGGLVLSAEEVVAALEIEGGRVAVVGRVLQRQAAPERRHPVEDARSRQCSGVGSPTSRADRGGRLAHRH